MTYLNSCFSNVCGNYAAAYGNSISKSEGTSASQIAGTTASAAAQGDVLDLSNAGSRLSLTQNQQASQRSNLRLNYYENVREKLGLGADAVIQDRFAGNMLGNDLLDSNSGKIGTQAELEDQLLSEKINQAIKKAGVRLEKNEKLNLTVNQNGYISVGEDISEEKRTKIESALNKSGNLGKDLLVSQARHLNGNSDSDSSKTTNSNAGVINRVLTDATLEKNFGLSVKDFEQSVWNEETGDWDGGLPFRCTAEGKENLAENIYTDSLSLFNGIDNYLYEDGGSKSDNFEFELTFYNGKLVRKEDDHPDEMPGIFNGRDDSFESLSKIVGLEEEVGDIESFVAALSEKTSKETEDLNRILSNLLSEVGLGGENRKITFAEDESGRIVIEGNIRKDLKRELENAVNRDEELVERIKNHKARLEILGGLSSQETDENEETKFLATSNFDLGADNFAAAREQLLKNYLKENGVNYDEISKITDQDGIERVALFDENGKAKDSSVLQGLVNGFWDLEDELVNTLNQKAEKPSLYKTSPARSIEIGDKSGSDEEPVTRALLSMKRGELTEATDEKPQDFNEAALGIRSAVAEKVKQYNEEIAKFDENLKITDFTVRIDDKGNMRIENVKTKGGDTDSISQASSFLNKTATSKQKEFAEDVLAQHDDEHGDVKEYKHYMTISSGLSEVLQIHSPEADRAALAEIGNLSTAISKDFGDFFRSMGIEDSFDIFWNPESGLSINQSFAGGFSGKQVKQMIGLLNERLASNDPFNDDLFDSVIPVEMKETMKKLCELDYAYSKLHDTGLKNRSVRFGINQ